MREIWQYNLIFISIKELFLYENCIKDKVEWNTILFLYKTGAILLGQTLELFTKKNKKLR